MGERMRLKLGNSLIDRAIAFIAILPFLFVFYQQFQAGKLRIPQITEIIQLGLIIITMLARRPAKRVTTNPLLWLLAFVATYWGLLTVALYQEGKGLASNTIV